MDAQLVSSLANFLGLPLRVCCTYAIQWFIWFHLTRSLFAGVGVLVLIFGYLYLSNDATDKDSVKRDKL